MPVLDPIEGQFLMELANPNVKTVGRPRLLKLLGIVEKLHTGIQAAEQKQGQADFLLNAFWLVAAGKIGEEEIHSHPRLSDEHRTDLLSMLQLRFDAEAWRNCTDYVPATALPEAFRVNADATELEANTEIHTAERVG